MKVFFCFRLFFILMLITKSAFSQSIVKSMDSSFGRLGGDRWNLDNYLWGFAKNKGTKYVKPLIDYSVIDNWRRIGQYLAISHNGKHFAYTIEGGSSPFDSNAKIDSLIVQSVDGSCHLAFSKATPGFFADNSRQYIFQKGAALCFLQLDGSQVKYVEGVGSYKVQGKGLGEWLAYQLNDGDSTVVLQNLITGREKRFFGVSNYKFANNKWFVCQIHSNSDKNGPKEQLLYQMETGIEKRYPFVVEHLFAENGKAVLLKIMRKMDKKITTSLEYVNFLEKREVILWSNKDNNSYVNSYSIDKFGEQVVFCIRDSAGISTGSSVNNSIWYYKKGMSKANRKVTNETAGIDGGFQIGGAVSFTDNGRYIKLFLQPKPSESKAHPNVVQLKVWDHKDLNLQSAQSDLSKQSRTYLAVMKVENGLVIRLENEGETIGISQGDFAMVKKLNKEIYGDRFWERGYGYERDSNWLVNFNDGSRHLLGNKDRNVTTIGPFWFSPSGNYLVYFDFDKECHYFSYNLRTGKITDISATVPNGQLGYIDPYLRTDKKPQYSLGLAAWLESDAGVLVYDNNDIWQFDLQGMKPAINLTNSFGRAQNIIFSLFNSQRFFSDIPVVNKGESLLLRAFNTNNKYSGFYRTGAGVDGAPQLLYMGRYFMNFILGCQGGDFASEGMQPIKAKDVNVWIVQRQSDTVAPNYYKTTDFKSFEKLTDFQPQRGYNWLLEELHSFKHLDGVNGQGILYKPENFDSSRKYPVLIVCYREYSNNIYQYPVPKYNMHAVTPGASPIWLLNNGYLIFTPDMYVTPLKYGPEAFNVIEGAARYLKQLPYVDVDKLGCCSHSWSAKLGSYILTHSKSFGAMAISEGFLYGNMMNVAFSTDEDGASRLGEVEEGFQFGNVWENKNSWIDQTTILNVNNASSSLLLFCNKKSSKEYQNQTLQLFTALRRLEKKVWWLEYAKGSHVLEDLDERKDYTIRYTQFFDHYLKDAPAPRWMTRGAGAEMKGAETSYALDPVGSCGRSCKICERWNEQYEKDPEMFKKPIGEWYLK